MRDIFILAISMVLMLAPSIAGLRGLRAGQIENRASSVFPGWTLASWLDSDAYASVGLWLRDNLPLRSEAITLNSWIGFSLLGESPPSVLIGRDGELFMTQNLLGPCEPAAAPRLTVEALSAASAALVLRGVPVYVVVSLGKASVYPDRLPALGVQFNTCAAAAHRQLRQGLQGETSFSLVPLWPVFEAEARAGRRLFPVQGRHWNAYAGLLQTRSLVEALAPGLWPEDAFRVARSAASEAEIPRMLMNLHASQDSDVYESTRPGISSKTTTQSLTASETDDIVRITSSHLTEAVIPGDTVVVHDSFMLESRGPFGLFTERIHYVHWKGLTANAQRLATLFENADRVVFQFVDDAPRPAIRGLKRLREVLAERPTPASGPGPSAQSTSAPGSRQ